MKVEIGRREFSIEFGRFHGLYDGVTRRIWWGRWTSSQRIYTTVVYFYGVIILGWVRLAYCYWDRR